MRNMRLSNYFHKKLRLQTQCFVWNSQVLDSTSRHFLRSNRPAKKYAVTDRHVVRWQILIDSLKNPVRGNLSVPLKRERDRKV